jgi:hypothetical protein
MYAFSVIHYCIAYSLYLNYIRLPVDTRAHFEHVQVIRCDIKLELVKKYKDVENEPIQEIFMCKGNIY